MGVNLETDPYTFSGLQLPLLKTYYEYYIKLFHTINLSPGPNHQDGAEISKTS